MNTMYMLLTVTFMFASSSLAFTPRYAPKNEMIHNSEIIAVVRVNKVVQKQKQGNYLRYSYVAIAATEKIIKGDAPTTIEFAANEITPGRYLVFLEKDNDFWTHTNWYLGLRHIQGDKVQWYHPGTSTGLSLQNLSEVLTEIEIELKNKFVKIPCKDWSRTKIVDLSIFESKTIDHRSPLVPELDKSKKVIGFKVDKVSPNTIAHEIGLRDGDLITQVNGQEFDSPSATLEMVRLIKSGEGACLTVIRKKEHTIWWASTTKKDSTYVPSLDNLKYGLSIGK